MNLAHFGHFRRESVRARGYPMDCRCVFDMDSRHVCLHWGHSSSTVVSSITVTFSLLAIKIAEPMTSKTMPEMA